MAAIKYFRGQKDPLSNMFSCEIFWKGHVFYSSEGIYQYEKALFHGNENIADIIKSTRNGFDCKREARKILISPEWHQSKLSIMHDILKEKFKQCESYRLELDRYDYFVEDTNDYFWAKRGLNKLGKLHREIKMANLDK